jgi:hypothetical protein
MKLGIAMFPADFAIRPDELARAVEEVGVGTSLTGRPRHGSRRTELPYRALVSGQNAKRSCFIGRAG